MMNTVGSKTKLQCFFSTSPVPSRAGTQTATGLQAHLFGMRIPEQKPKKEKRLGYLRKTELLAEVRKIFPGAKVLPNPPNTSKTLP